MILLMSETKRKLLLSHIIASYISDGKDKKGYNTSVKIISFMFLIYYSPFQQCLCTFGACISTYFVSHPEDIFGKQEKVT